MGQQKDININVGGIKAIVFDSLKADIIYAGTDLEGVYKSIDGEMTWNAVNTGLENLYVHALAINPTNPSIVYVSTIYCISKSTNGGGTWNMVYKDFALSLAINPADPNIIYAGTASGVIKSMDGGATWSPVNTGLTNIDVESLVINPINPSTIFAGTRRGIFKSTNAGTTWNAANTGITPGIINVLALNPKNPNVVYARASLNSNEERLFKSTNGGATWNAVNTDIGPRPYMGPRGINCLDFNPKNPSVVYVGTWHGLIRNTNEGMTWIGIPDRSSTIAALKQNPHDVSVQFSGITKDGYVKYIQEVSVKYNGLLAGSPFQISYVLTSAKGHMERNEDGTSLIAGIPLEVIGELSHIDSSGNHKATKILGIIYNDKRDIIGSWLIAKTSDLPTSTLSKILVKLINPIQTGNEVTKIKLSSPIWLFHVNPDYTLTLE